MWFRIRIFFKIVHIAKSCGRENEKIRENHREEEDTEIERERERARKHRFLKKTAYFNPAQNTAFISFGFFCSNIMCCASSDTMHYCVRMAGRW